jgi:hypothetical protein
VWSPWVEGWTTKIVEGNAKPGATVVLDLGPPKRTTCTILACQPPTRLAATWTYGEPDGVKPDELEVRLATERRGTLLTLEHRSEADLRGACSARRVLVRARRSCTSRSRRYSRGNPPAPREPWREPAYKESPDDEVTAAETIRASRG